MDVASEPETYQQPESKAQNHDRRFGAIEQKLSNEVHQMQTLELAGDLDKANGMIQTLQRDVEGLNGILEGLRTEHKTQLENVQEQQYAETVRNACLLTWLDFPWLFPDFPRFLLINCSLFVR
jgi:predicted  nucleic acid-binding Zn-ribbon protein